MNYKRLVFLNSQIFTINTMIKSNLISKENKLFLNDYLLIYNQIKFKYTQKMQHNSFSGFTRKMTKEAVDPDNILAYRVFKGIESTVKSLISSQLTHKKNNINSIEDKIKEVKKEIINLKVKIANSHKIVPKYVCYSMQKQINKKSVETFAYKAKRLNKLNQKLLNLQQQISSNHTSILYGSSKLLKARHTINSKDFQKINKWQKDWHLSRANEMFFIGSTDETMGNSNAHFIRGEGNDLLLKILIPLSMRQNKKYNFKNNQTYVQLPIEFKYAKNIINNHLLVHENSTAKERKNSQIKNSVAIKIKRTENNNLYIHASFELLPEKKRTCKEYGTIGIDINPDHLAIVELDNIGNKSNAFKINLDLENKSTGQKKHIIFLGIREITNYAKLKGKSIVIENLDFTKKRAALRVNQNSKYSFMLSSFNYAAITYAFMSCCFKEKVELIKVDPAYTSQFGKIKYQTLHGLSIHEAAAMVIGRKGMGLKEKLPKVVTKIKVTKQNDKTKLLFESTGHVSPELRSSVRNFCNMLKKESAWNKLIGCNMPTRFQGLLSKVVSPLTTEFYLPFLIK